MTQFVVRLVPGLARKLKGKASLSANSLLKIINSHNAKIGPPTGDVGESARYFPLELNDANRGEDLLEALRRHPGVEAAFLKPDDEAP